jgi:hypothetical protein
MGGDGTGRTVGTAAVDGLVAHATSSPPGGASADGGSTGAGGGGPAAAVMGILVACRSRDMTPCTPSVSSRAHGSSAARAMVRADAQRPCIFQHVGTGADCWSRLAGHALAHMAAVTCWHVKWRINAAARACSATPGEGSGLNGTKALQRPSVAVRTSLCLHPSLLTIVVDRVGCKPCSSVSAVERVLA